MTRPRLGVSSCLLGQRVRYDGGHKRHEVLVALASQAEVVAVCPESEIGLGVPRPPMHLEERGGRVSLVVSETGDDLSDRMHAFAAERIPGLGMLDGYVLKARSPSCGLSSVLVSGRSEPGAGVFAAQLVASHPLLSVVEEGTLDDPAAARHVVRRLFASARLRELFASEWTLGELLAHHTAHKMLLFSCDPGKTRELGALLGQAGHRPREGLAEDYRQASASILATQPTLGRETDTLQHCVGYFDDGSLERGAAADLVDQLQAGEDNLGVTRERMRALVIERGIEYLSLQHYLEFDAAERRALTVVASA